MRAICAFCIVLLATTASVGAVGRGLRQSSGYTRPVSATLADLVNDPQGRGHLLTALGDYTNYEPQYMYHYSAPNYNADPSMDPGSGVPPTSNASVTGSWQVVGSSGALAIHAIPFTNELVLFMARPNNANGSEPNPPLAVENGTQEEVAAIYNLTSNTFRPFHITEHPFCSAHTLLPDGRGIIVGGDNLNLNPPFLTSGIQAIRVFDPTTQTYSVVGTLDRGRWYPSVMTLADGNLLILGGIQQEAGGWAGNVQPSSSDNPITTCSPNAGGSIADPSYDNPSFSILSTTNFTNSPALTLTILLEGWPISSYPYAAQLPSGSVLVIAGSNMEALYFSPNGATADMAVGTLPSLPVPVNYPQYNSFTLLPLNPPQYSAQVLLAGGSSEYCANQETAAGTTSFLVDVTPGADHSIQKETLAYPRIMGDLTLLPDGRVFLCNGAQVGIAGGAGPNAAAANIGTTVAEIYDPSKPVGSRWSKVADSGIWRLYHSWAFLTRNATVVVSGSEPTAERRVQIWTPDYLSNGKPRPTITSAPSTIGYNQTFGVSYSNVQSIDRVVLNRVVSVTHGVHFDQRQVVLACTPGAAQTVNCAAPPNGSVAPPGQYMLFALSGGVPSIAPYVSLQYAGAGPASAPSATQASG